MNKYSPANYKNIGSSIVVILFSIGLFIATFFQESATVTTLGPEFMPRVVAIALFILGCMNLLKAIRGFRFLKDHGNLIPARENKRTFKEFFYDNLDWASGILIMAYVIAIYYWGFLLPSVIYMFLQILLYTTANKKRNWILYVLVSIVFPVVVYYLFRNYFHLMLPKGILG